MNLTTTAYSMIATKVVHIKIMTESETSGIQFRWEPTRFFALLAENERFRDVASIFAKNVSVAPGFAHLAMLQDFWGGAALAMHRIALRLHGGLAYHPAERAGFDIHRHDLGAIWLVLIVRPALDGVGESGQQLVLRKGHERQDAAAWIRLHRKRTRHILRIYSVRQPGVVGFWSMAECDQLAQDADLLCNGVLQAAKWISA